MPNFMVSFLDTTYDSFVLILQYIWSSPVLKFFTLLVEHRGFTIFWMVLFIFFVAVSNQINNFATDTDERPLPLKLKMPLSMIPIFIWIPWLLSTYWLLFNIILDFNIMYGRDLESWKDYAIDAAIFLPLYFLLMMYTFYHAEKTPFLKRYIDQKIMKRLNEISVEFQLINSGKVIYKPEGTPRITKDYDVVPYFKDGMLFHGIDMKDKPVYTDFWKSMDGHFTVIGGTGAGKGVLTRIYLAQMIKKPITNIIFDPKPDDYMYFACVDFAKQNDKKIHIIDLDAEQPQISLFKGITKLEFRNIFISALELHSQKQTNARVYAERAERGIYTVAEKLFTDNMTAVELYQAIKSCEELKDEESLINLFYYLQETNIFNTKTGLSLKELIESKDVVLIRCSNARTNSIARSITQIVFTSLFEAISRREKENATQCVVVIDEFKFIMNTAIMDNLATIRDQKCSLIFNFQDISNFTTSPNQALKNPSYAQELLSNSHFIAIHNASESALIKLIQGKCGKKSYDKPFEEDATTAGGGRDTSSDRRWVQHTEFSLTEDEVSSGGKRTAILLSSLLEGDSFARIHTDIIKTPSYKFAITHNSDKGDSGDDLADVVGGDPRFNPVVQNPKVEISKSASDNIQVVAKAIQPNTQSSNESINDIDMMYDEVMLGENEYYEYEHKN
jgi:hypothetical protein